MVFIKITSCVVIIPHQFKNINNNIKLEVIFVMPAQWTGDLVGQMHNNKISKRRLAEYMGVTPEYVSMVLNGHREPAGAEETFRAAVNAIIQSQNHDSA